MKSCFNCIHFDVEKNTDGKGLVECKLRVDEYNSHVILNPTYFAQSCILYDKISEDAKCYTSQFKADGKEFTCHACEFFERWRASDDRATVIKCGSQCFGINSKYEQLFKDYPHRMESDPPCPYAYYVKNGYSIIGNVRDSCRKLPDNRLVHVYNSYRKLLFIKPAAELISDYYKTAFITFEYDYADFTELILVNPDSLSEEPKRNPATDFCTLKLVVKDDLNNSVVKVKKNNLSRPVAKVKVRKLNCDCIRRKRK